MTDYPGQLTELLYQMRPKMPCTSTIEVKPFFGGAAAYVNGHISFSLTKVGLGLKLPEADRTQLLRQKKAKPLRYFPKAPIKKQYVLFPKSFLQDSAQVKSWLEKSIAFTMCGHE